MSLDHPDGQPRKNIASWESGVEENARTIPKHWWALSQLHEPISSKLFEVQSLHKIRNQQPLLMLPYVSIYLPLPHTATVWKCLLYVENPIPQFWGWLHLWVYLRYAYICTGKQSLPRSQYRHVQAPRALWQPVKLMSDFSGAFPFALWWKW